MANRDTPVALITGAAQRIGQAITRHLHQDGFAVVIHYRNSGDAAEILAAELNTVRPDSASIFQANLSDKREIDRMCEHVETWTGHCDLVINNASSFYATPLGKITETQWDDLFASNAKAPLFISQALAPLLRDGGSIVNIADIHAERPLNRHTVYCMAKAANIMLTKSLALELAPRIRVNGIAPGAILPPSGGSQNSDNIAKEVPLQMMGGVTAIVEAVDYLVKARYVTGQIINVDGGRTLKQ